MVSASQASAAVDSIRFDRVITSFEFSPSIGIMAKRFAALADELEDLREPLTRAVEDVMTLSILENFMQGGRPQWEPLAEDTLKKRQRDGTGSMILVRSGNLAEVASSKEIWSIGRQTALVRALPQKAWYGKIHQAGTSATASGGNWFEKYQTAARKVLGPKASQKEVDSHAYALFDERARGYGPSPRSSTEIPARAFIMFQDEDIDAIEQIFLEWLEEKIQEAGLR
jgi:phage gpG-like protein